ncbi:MAG: hypothetical protein IPP74_15025 [Alphaproteobacteria bacterium]|nr:hypothetical protein [Alphaproteobacteria bacterium]
MSSICLLAVFGRLFVTALPLLHLDDARTLRTSGLPQLLRAFHQQALDSGKIGHALPQLFSGEIESLDLFKHGDTTLRLSPLIGLEFRNPDDEYGWAMDAGARLVGTTNNLAFWVEAEMVMAKTTQSLRSWDGQYQEFQQSGDNSNLSYTSYSRYEGMLNAMTTFGQFSFGRSKVHWGPSVEYPLVLGSYSSPYPFFDWQLEWGDFRIHSLWATLSIDGSGRFRSNTDSRSLYAHRYEWLGTSWLTIGASEAMFLYNHEEPAGIFPFAPLFMEKGQGLEDGNNGELAFDVEIRPFHGLRLYSEFLIDDMSEPFSLFNGLWKNRWAYTVGSHYAFRWHESDFGLIFEYSHVEPWVYTHYVEKTVQATHQGNLLGNHNGPNSRSININGYGACGNLHLESSMEFVWKGADMGSRWTDTLSDNETTQKTFLAGGGKFGVRNEIHMGWSFGYATAWFDLAKVIYWTNTQSVKPSAPVALRLEFRY